MTPSNEWIEFTSRGRKYRAQFTATGLIVDGLRDVAASVTPPGEPVAARRPSEPEQWDEVKPYFYRGSSEILNALKSALGIRDRDRRRRARGTARRYEPNLAAWLAARQGVTVA